MGTTTATTQIWRSRWAAIGAAVAVAFGAGGVGIGQATVDDFGPKPVFVSIVPCRMVDTRPAPDNVGPRSTPLAAATPFSVTGSGESGQCQLPDSATAIALNVTALNASTPTNLVLYPSDEPKPDASHLNPSPGQPPTPNAVTVDLSFDQRFDIVNAFGTVDVIIDAVGYYADHSHPQYVTKFESSRTRYVRQVGEASIAVADGPRTIVSLEMGAPVPGTIAASATWESALDIFEGPASDALESQTCTLTDGLQDYSYQNQMAEIASFFDGETVTGAFDIEANELVTIAFYCETSGDDGTEIIRIQDATLIAQFTPTVQEGE